MKQPNSQPNFHRSLDRYGAMTGAFLGIASVAQAAVVYTDVDPDVTFNSTTFDIDLNADGIIDFSVTQSTTDLRVSYYISVAFVGIGGNNSAGFGVVKSGIFADALSSGELIGPGSPIAYNISAGLGAHYLSFGYTFTVGLWGGETDKYLGVSFNVGSDTHYGWIRADVHPWFGNVTIKGFAYEDQPGVAIAAGDEGSTVCSSAAPPGNQAHLNEATRVVLSWDPLPGAVACQVQGQRLPTGPAPSVSILGADIGTTNVPNAVAGAGTTWTWQVRCACSIAPLDVSAFSGFGDTFSVPVARQAEAPLVDLTAYPNPATDRVLLGLGDAVSRETHVRILDLTGNVVDFMQIPAEARNMELDVAALPNGVYFVQVGDLKPISLEVIH